MSNSVSIASKIYVLLCTLGGKEKILLPNTMVAEIIKACPIYKDEHSTLQMITWRGLNLPVINWHRLIFKHNDKHNIQYIMILNCIDTKIPYKFYGVILDSLPQLLQIKAENLDNFQVAQNEFIAFTGELFGQQIYYLDYVAIQNKVAEIIKTSSR